jgi:mannose-6-phosphate isomerase-like protein (cupin superfamily)
MPPIIYPAAERRGAPRSHAFIAPDPKGWATVALMEWELTTEEWVDEHPHDEFNYVLEGTLFVTCDGETVEVPQGSIVRVPAGSTGRYWAPDHARMLAIYGPNPDGAPSTVGGLRSLDPSC